ncbi:MAG: nuclear transport factor 2 family protein [Pseudomonadota bacterium]
MTRSITAVLLLIPFVQPVFAQWSDRQDEIWSVIQATWAEEAGESGKWPTKFATSDYQSWGQDEALPQTLGTVDRTLKYWNQHSKLKHHRLKPASITVNKDTAVVNYYATEYRETTEGSRSRSVTAITETLVFRDGRWRFLASSTWMPKPN